MIFVDSDAQKHVQPTMSELTYFYENNKSSVSVNWIRKTTKGEVAKGINLKDFVHVIILCESSKTSAEAEV